MTQVKNNTKIADVFWDSYNLIEKDNDVVAFRDLQCFLASRYKIAVDDVKKWVAKQQILGTLNTTYVAGSMYLVRK